MLGSGFWLIASERFDPHTAKKVFGQIAGAGTLGGMLGGLDILDTAAGWFMDQYRDEGDCCDKRPARRGSALTTPGRARHLELRQVQF